jgi:hypothetical protein
MNAGREPGKAVEATFARIAKDHHYVEVQRLVTRPIDNRLFLDWATRDDPARSRIWSERPGVPVWLKID